MNQEQEETAEYQAFVDKFKPKKTTDDCYTPQPVYAVIADWVSREYRIRHCDMVRPFYPGGDYQHYDYPEGAVVVDNPPFSILTKICRWYDAHGIKYFLFAPYLTLFSVLADCCHIAADCDITYENGAKVRTSFVTNLDPYEARTAPDLSRAVNDRAKEIANQGKKELPKYVYPYDVITSARMSWLDKHGIDLRIKREDCTRISALDHQRAFGKGIFGCGYLLSERAAAERAAAERAAAERAAAQVWELSDRERALQASLG